MPRTARPELFSKPGGDTRYRIRWLDHEGKRQAQFFDSFVEAERALRERQTEADDVRRGLRRPTPTDHTFNELADYWLKHRAVEKRSKADDESIIRRHLRPAFGILRLCDIDTEHFDRYKAERRGLKPKTVANQLILLGTMFRLAAEELRWLTAMPIIRKPRVDPDDDVDQPWLKTAYGAKT